MKDEIEGRLLERGGPGYEEARRGALWNGLVPERYPDAILVAASAADCVRGVRLAGRRGMKVGVRSGGHSWAGNHIRDGGLLLDLSGLTDVEVDRETMRASAQPGCAGNRLDAELERHDLFFPAGHCPGVAIGGYLLQGGFGWNGRVHGPACMSVEAIDVVTADGDLVRADADSNADLFWAARGAGPGFFGVVTRYHLKLYERPSVIANGAFTYPLDVLEEVFGWADEIGPQIPDFMELMLVVHRDAEGEVEVVVTGPVLAGSESQAREALALLETCPVLDRAKLKVPYMPARLSDLYSAVHESYPDGHRYAVDNMWTGAPAERLLPGIREIAESLPPAPSHMLWMNWGDSPRRPDMAYGLEDRTYIALYAVWREAAQDARNIEWATGHMHAMAPLATGVQLADENLGRRPAPFTSADRMERLDQVRSDRDPEGRFHGWMGRV